MTIPSDCGTLTHLNVLLNSLPSNTIVHCP